METKILIAAGLFFFGWLWFYIFMRQFLFNYLTAYPLIKKMQSIDKDLIAPGSRRYTATSVFVCLLISAIILFIILHFCPGYMIISFAVGAFLCFILIIGKLSASNEAMFENFCTAYCRFIPDDELRTIMYNKDTRKINKRLRELGYQESFVPEFK